MNATQQKLVTDSLKLAEFLCGRFKKAIKAADWHGLVSASNYGLCLAAERFDPSRGVKFSTYAFPLIVGEMRQFVRTECRHRHDMLSDEILSKEATPEESASFKDEFNFVKSHLGRDRYERSSSSRLSLSEISVSRGITKPAACQHVKRARRILSEMERPCAN